MKIVSGFLPLTILANRFEYRATVEPTLRFRKFADQIIPKSWRVFTVVIMAHLLIPTYKTLEFDTVKILGNEPAWIKGYHSLVAQLCHKTIPLAMPNGVFWKSCPKKSTLMQFIV